MVTYWAHNGLLRKGEAACKIGGRGERDSASPPPSAGEGLGEGEAVSGKMSRSKGAGGLADLIKKQGGERIRFFLLRTHYRSTVLFNEPAIEEAGVGLESFYRLFKRYQRITGKDFYALTPPRSREAGALKPGDSTALQPAAKCREKFLAAMDDDFNTGGAIGELFELARSANKLCDDEKLEAPGTPDPDAVATLTQMLTTLRELTSILGIFLKLPVTSGGDDLLAKIMPLVIELRAEARKKKDFATADAIRDGLAPIGITLEDRADGTEWSGGGADAINGLMQLLIQLRQTARKNKDFATGDAIRDRLASSGITLEDRAGGTEWSAS
jgi:cysteinyl-tRNA synthetase